VAAIAKQWPYYTPRQTLWLLFKEASERTEEEQRYVQAVLDSLGRLRAPLPPSSGFVRS